MKSRCTSALIRLTILSIVMLGLTSSIFAATTNANSKLTLGVETDVLPFVLKGYLASAWGGAANLRLRALVAHVRKPDILLPSGFTDNVLQSYALLVDYFPGEPSYQQWWVSVGIVHWAAEISEESTHERQAYESELLSFDLGYSWKFYDNFYLSPWIGCHVRLAGDSQLYFKSSTFEPPAFNPEASLKVGWIF